MHFDEMWNEIKWKFYSIIRSEKIDLVEDTSQFIYVDGEEGDYGVIGYYFNGMKVFDKIIEGGDSEYLVFTDFGKQFFVNYFINALTTLKTQDW